MISKEFDNIKDLSKIDDKMYKVKCFYKKDNLKN